MHTLTVNYNAVVSICEPLAAHLAERGSGWIAVIGSVAGDRGRQSNYLYGSAKAGASAYCQGLRNRLYHRGVHVLTVKPGLVATAMTEGLVNPNSPMVARPEQVAGAIVRAIDRRRNVIYTPWFWRAIMAAIRAVPEAVFKRLGM
jgi:short-subunit dehydrogenase